MVGGGAGFVHCCGGLDQVQGSLEKKAGLESGIVSTKQCVWRCWVVVVVVVVVVFVFVFVVVVVAVVVVMAVVVVVLVPDSRATASPEVSKTRDS